MIIAVLCVKSGTSLSRGQLYRHLRYLLGFLERESLIETVNL
jgi:hypothetical protein